MAVSKRLRYEVLRRDNHACRYCGAKAPEVHLTVDHVVPVALGGTDEPANLATACEDCNSGKTSSNPDAPLVQDVAQDALRWSKAREMALDKLAKEQQKRGEYIRDFIEFWDGEAPSFAELPANAWDSIGRFYDAGLPWWELTQAAITAFAAQHVPRRARFTYMCGVAWKLVDRINAMAMEIVQSDSFEGG